MYRHALDPGNMNETIRMQAMQGESTEGERQCVPRQGEGECPRGPCKRTAQHFRSHQPG